MFMALKSIMVKFSLFGAPSRSKIPPKVQDINKYKEIAYRMLKSGKSESEVAAYLKSQGLPFEVIDNILNSLIKSAAINKPPENVPTPQNINAPETKGPSPMNISRIAQPTQPTQPDLNKLVDDILEKILVEMEEIVDVIIEKRYGNLKKEIEEMRDARRKLEEIEGNITTIVEDIKKDLNQKIEDIAKSINNLENRMDEIEPKINALESAFKDNIPTIINDLREIEEKISKKEENEDVMVSLKEKEKQHEEDKSSKLKLDDLFS